MTTVSLVFTLLLLASVGNDVPLFLALGSAQGQGGTTLSRASAPGGTSESVHSVVENLPMTNATVLLEDTDDGITDLPVTSEGLEDLGGTEGTTAQDWRWTSVTWTWNMVLQLILALLGVFGNLLVIMVLFKRRRVSQSTDTLLGALAVADFFTSIFIIPIPKPQYVPSTWVGELYCRAVHTSFFMWLTVTASVYTLITISIERLMAVVFPFTFSCVLQKHHVVTAIGLIWLLALARVTFIPLTISVNGETDRCVFGYASAEAQLASGVISYILHLLLPTLIMLITQAITARALYVQSKRFAAESDGQSGSTSGLRLLKAKNRVVRLLLIVILIFICSWGPNSTAYFLFNIGAIAPSYLYGNLNRTFTLLAFCNSCANPFIYAIQYPQFRAAIKDLFNCSSRPLEALFESHQNPTKPTGKSTQITTESDRKI